MAAALLAALPVAMTWAPLPAAAQSRAATPEIENLEINADNGLAVGSTIDFTLRGTARGQARVQVQGTGVALALREAAPGVYTGRYTVRGADRLDPAQLVRASLSVGPVRRVARFSFPPSFVALASQPAPRPAPPQARQPQQPEPQPDPQQLAAQRRAQEEAQRRAQEEAQRQAQQETRQRAQQWAREQAQAREQARLRSHSSRAGTTVVYGTFDDRLGNASGRAVDPQSVRLAIAGRDVTAQSRITPHSFSYEGRLPPGRHAVEVTARDAAGTVVQSAWTIELGEASGAAAASGVAAVPPPPPDLAPAAAPGADASSALSLQLAGPSGRNRPRGSDVVIQGRTAPGASVRVQVDAIPPSAGDRTSVAQTLSQQSVVADPEGNFSFNLGSYRAVPGTRLEVALVARQGEWSAERRLPLTPRPG